MTEQETVNQTSTKVERSASNQSCRLSYDCLIASAKTFIHHFSALTDEEKVEYKSLTNHVKQLGKCNENIKKLSTPVKRAIAPKVVVEQAATGAVAEATTSKAKKTSGSKKSAKEEQSPTAQVAAATVSEQKKGGRAKKTETAPVVEAAPVVAEPAKKAAPKKAATKTK